MSKSQGKDPFQRVLAAFNEGRDRERCFSEIFRRYDRPIRDFLRGLVRNRADLADDLTQQLFLHVYQRGGGFPVEPKQFERYLFGAARNAFIDMLRRQQRHGDDLLVPHGPGAEKEPVATTPSPEECAMGRQALENTVAAIDELPPEQRLCMHLLCEGRTPAEIAVLTGKARGTVKATIDQARKKLRRQLHGDSEGTER